MCDRAADSTRGGTLEVVHQVIGGAGWGGGEEDRSRSILDEHGWWLGGGMWKVTKIRRSLSFFLSERKAPSKTNLRGS